MVKPSISGPLLALLLIGCSSQEMSQEERKADAFADAGREAIQRKDYTAALRHLLEANKLNPDDLSIMNNIGVTYAAKNEFAKAEEFWRKILKKNPKFQDARLNLGVLYFNAKHYAEAEKILKEITKDLTYPKLDQVAMKLAQIYEIQKRHDLVEDQLKSATKENPGNCTAWYQLGSVQKEKGNYAEAIQSLKGAVKGVCYKNPEVHYEIANLLLKARDLPKAKVKLLEIIQLFPTSEWASRSEATLNMIR